jgi:hypothetical protein
MILSPALLRPELLDKKRTIPVPNLALDPFFRWFHEGIGMKKIPST